MSNRGLGPLSFNFNDLSFKGKAFSIELQEEEMIIRNTFQNAQMGEIVHYGNMQNYKIEKLLKWVDKQPKLNPGDKSRSLANLVPINDTFNFSTVISTHLEMSREDVKGCMRRSRLRNKYKKSNITIIKPSSVKNHQLS